MRVEINIPDNLHVHEVCEIFTHLEAIYAITGKKKSTIQPAVITQEMLDGAFEEVAKKQEKFLKKEKKPTKGLPALTKTEQEREREIAKTIGTIQGTQAERMRLVRTCYKNLTKIYGIVWEQAVKDFKAKWNIDSDIKVSKRRCVISSGNLFSLYITQLMTMRDHFNTRRYAE